MPFDMTFEINDIAKGIRTNLTLPSTTLWYNARQQIAKALNMFPDSLHLQYRFSNEQKGSLPFNLDTVESYEEMREKLEPFVVPELTKQGKPRKKKLVTVQIFDKNSEAEGGPGGKNAKVRASDIWNIFTSVYLLFVGQGEIFGQNPRCSAY